MYARLPREMLASVTRSLNVPVGTNVIVEALNYASMQLAGYYSWPWFLSEATTTFRPPVTGIGTINSTTLPGRVTYSSISDPLANTYVNENWRVMFGQHDYPVLLDTGTYLSFDTTKVTPVDVTAQPFRLFQSSIRMPDDFRQGSDFACYNTTLRYRIRHVNRMSFERHWQAYKQMATNTALVFADAEPFYDASNARWVDRIQLCPPPAAVTQIRIAYQKTPAQIDLVTNAPTEWPEGYDEVIELLALGRIGESTGDGAAVMAARRATGLIRQLRGAIATAVVDDTPIQNTSFGGASWEDGGLSVLPREV